MPNSMGKQGYDRVTKEVLSRTVVRDRYILVFAGTESVIPLKTTYRFVYLNSDKPLSWVRRAQS